MSTARTYIFVMWGRNFEEASATIFVTELRQAGLCVKVVGLDGRYTAGEHGLALVPDLTLGQALPLAQRALCVIVPCSGAWCQRLHNDPRIIDFFQRAHGSHAQFVVGSLDGRLLTPRTEPTALASQPVAVDVTAYPPGDALPPFVRNLAEILRAS